MRKSYVQIEGQLYEKAGDNTVIIAGQKWGCIAGHWMPLDGHFGTSAMVMPDIQPYQSVIDGSLITSRSRHREHLSAHGCIEMGNERPKPYQPVWTASDGLKQELAARLSNWR